MPGCLFPTYHFILPTNNIINGFMKNCLEEFIFLISSGKSFSISHITHIIIICSQLIAYATYMVQYNSGKNISGFRDEFLLQAREFSA